MSTVSCVGGSRLHPVSSIPAVHSLDVEVADGEFVVLVVGDGAEWGSGVHAYEHVVVERALPVTGRPLPPDWALKVPPVHRLAGTTPVAGARKGLPS